MLWKNNPNATCYFCGRTCAVGIVFGGLVWCNAEQCIKQWYWRNQWRNYYASLRNKKNLRLIREEQKHRGTQDFSYDEYERVLNKRYRFQPKYRDMMVAKHRTKIAENLEKLGTQRKLKTDEVKAIDSFNQAVDKEYEYAVQQANQKNQAAAQGTEPAVAGQDGAW